MAFTLPRMLTVAAIFAAIAASPAVLAHAHLKNQYPAADAAVTAAPQALTLDFSEGIEPNFILPL